MKINITRTDDYTILTVNELKLNSLISPQLRSDLILLSEEGQKNIIVDLSQVSFIDSSGLSCLLVGHRLCKDMLGLFVITGLNSSVAKLLTISQLDAVLSVAETSGHAIELVTAESRKAD